MTQLDAEVIFSARTGRKCMNNTLSEEHSRKIASAPGMPAVSAALPTSRLACCVI